MQNAITISTELSSSYAIAYVEADGVGIGCWKNKAVMLRESMLE